MDPGWDWDFGQELLELEDLALLLDLALRVKISNRVYIRDTLAFDATTVL
jgi:hypothetical protein